MKTSSILIPVFILLVIFNISAQHCTYVEENGILSVEAENFTSQTKTSQREWFIMDGSSSTPTPDPDPSHHSSASGGKYIELLPDTRVSDVDPLEHGVSFSDIPGTACILSYDVYFNSIGKYYVWVRAYSTGSEDNGIHVGLDGTWPVSGKKMQWCLGKNQWTWESKQRTAANHCGEEQLIYIDVTTTGYHTINFSMREDGFEFDKFVLSKVYTKPTGSGPAVIEMDCEEDSSATTTPEGVKLEGDPMRWHKISLTFDGPSTSEIATINPFTNYRLDVTFTHTDGKSYTVPGYYAACDNPAEGCNSGDKWKAHFTPDRTGKWTYSIDFKTGTNVAVNGGGSSAGYVDGKSGHFTISESDKTGRDHRAADKGKLRYVGEHYLRYTGTGGNTTNGDWFVKAGADAPENTLAYEDFDDTPNRGSRRKSWAPHQQDYNASDAGNYTWKNGKGTELLGVVNYLSSKGVNAFSFLTLSLHGDDENVFPYLMKVNETTYNSYGDATQWSSGVYHDRFDVSKLAQWEKIFEYSDKKGMFMHFKTMETENDNIMDNNTFGNERKLYYRELVARFGHHLALNWNLCEESTLTDNVVQETSAYIKSIDPYDNHIVMHSFPSQKSQRYTPQLGSNSDLTGVSMQTEDRNYGEIQTDVLEWIEKSASANKKWVICVDEPGDASIGIDNDDNGTDDKLVRNMVLWGTLLSGGMGVEYYYGYQTNQTDLDAQDHRSRDQKYTEASYALDFMNTYINEHLPLMSSNDGVTAATDDYVFAKSGELYVVYRPNGGSTSINLPLATWKVQWYNPRTGGGLTVEADITNILTAPNSDDWVALITNNGVVSTNQNPLVSFTSPLFNQTFVEGDDIGVTVVANDNDGDVVGVKLYLDDILVREISIPPYEFGGDNLENEDVLLREKEAGIYVLKVIAEDNQGATTTKTILVEVKEKGPYNAFPINDAYLQGINGTNFNNVDLRVESGNRETYLMFDLSTLPTGVIESASLELTVGSDAGSGKLLVYSTENGWSESLINGGNAPSTGIEITSKTTTYQLNQTYAFDVSNANFSNQQISFVLKMGAGSNDVSFASKEHATIASPKLVIILKDDPITNIDIPISTQEEILLYPSPNEGQFTVKYSIIRETELSVYDLSGEKIYSKILNQSGEDLTTQINIGKKPVGIYFIKLTSVNKSIVRKFTITN